MIAKKPHFRNHKKPLAERIKMAVEFGPVHTIPPPKARLQPVKADK